jgi:hypothetical protein
MGSTTTLTIGFDDLTSDPNHPISSYDTFDWSNVYVYNGIGANGGGYRSGIVSPPNAAFNGRGNLATISRATPFSVISVYATAAGAAQTVTFTGSNNGRFDQAITIAGPTFIDFGSTFIGITSFSFVGLGQAVLDDLTVSFDNN